MQPIYERIQPDVVAHTLIFLPNIEAHKHIWMCLLGRGVGDGGEWCPNDPNKYYKEGFFALIIMPLLP